ncbi:MAG: hypothetical protein POG74_11340 [Acidocella sp.]|nr:hypothetical protein [Acidocella sp.]
MNDAPASGNKAAAEAPPVPGGHMGLIARFGPSLVLVLAFAALALLRHANLELYFQFQQWTDHAADYTPFVDIQAILQAESCWQQGVNVYAPSACMGGGFFNYSPFLLWLMHLPLSGADAVPAAIITGLLFIASLTLLPAVQSVQELWVRLAVIISPATLYALERANLDATIFAICMLAGWLLGRNLLLRMLGYGLILLVALAKFYPVFALISIIRERTFVFVTAAATCFGLLLLGLLVFKAQTSSALAIIPQGWPFGGLFGSINIPYGIRVLRAPGDFFGGMHLFKYNFTWFDIALFTLLRLGALLLFVTTIPLYRDHLPPLRSHAMGLFVIGAAILVGCFFTVQSANYREIFFILTVPGLSLMAATCAPELQRRMHIIIAAVVFTLWQPFVRGILFAGLGLFANYDALGFPQFIFWLCRELLFWWLMIQFAAIIAASVLPELRPWRVRR